MQIKKQKHVVTLYRCRYVKPEYIEFDGKRAILTGTGRSRQDKIGSFASDVLRYEDVPAAVIEALDPEEDEPQQLRDWFETEGRERWRRLLTQAPQAVEELMDALAQRLEAGEIVMDEVLADALWSRWERMSRHLRKTEYQQRASKLRRGLVATEEEKA